jgi:hypothetical protein
MEVPKKKKEKQLSGDRERKVLPQGNLISINGFKT